MIHLDTDVLTFEDFVVIEELLGDTENATSGRSPHVAFMTHEAIRAMSDMIVDYREFQFPRNVNPILAT